MANITQLKHLEHIEDEMLNHGVDGCTASVSAMKEMLKMLGKKPSSGYKQTKWDGAPSVVCGKHPITGRFFVGTKSVFNLSLIHILRIRRSTLCRYRLSQYH